MVQRSPHSPSRSTRSPWCSSHDGLEAVHLVFHCKQKKVTIAWDSQKLENWLQWQQISKATSNLAHTCVQGKGREKRTPQRVQYFPPAERDWPLPMVSSGFPALSKKSYQAHPYLVFLRERAIHGIFRSKKDFCRQSRASLIAQASFPQIYGCPNHIFSLQRCPDAFTSLCALKVRKCCQSNLQTGDETEEVQGQGQLSGQGWKRWSHPCLQNP